MKKVIEPGQIVLSTSAKLVTHTNPCTARLLVLFARQFVLHNYLSLANKMIATKLQYNPSEKVCYTD
jgi:hypothetical protein